MSHFVANQTMKGILSIMKSPLKPWLCFVLVLVSLLIAIISFSGIILKDDSAGKIIFGIVWTFIAFIWIGFYVRSRNKSQTPDDKAGA
jgi:hypothetical protein